MAVFEAKAPTRNVLIGSMGFSVLTCALMPTVPAFLLTPILTLLGQGDIGFSLTMMSLRIKNITFGLVFAYSVPGLLGLASLWYASRLDFDDPKHDRFRVILYCTLGYFFAGFVGGYAWQTHLHTRDLLPLMVQVFVGTPVLLTLPMATFGLFVSGLIVSPRAYQYLTARYDLKRKFAGAVGAAPSGMSELQKRLVSRQTPPDQLIEDAERFRVESTISDLMIEVEQLRAEIEILSERHSGGRA